MAFSRFNRGNDRSGGGRDFNRGSFNKGPRGPVEMHATICSNCGKNCEVPFRPTGTKPVFCSDCFERNQGGTDNRRPEGRNNDRFGSFESRPSFRQDRPKPMFDAICDNCKNNCQVPFRPSSDKPVYCSNCYGKDEIGNKETDKTLPSLKTQVEAINAKLDKLLALLIPASEELEKEIKSSKPKKQAVSKEVVTETVEEAGNAIDGTVNETTEETVEETVEGTAKVESKPKKRSPRKA